ncbi:MAG TPA: hypothetical protein VM184_04955 [Gaiellaceae bacterium]|nr:hypothetical protein [Gaiellaceae bacterium]
MPKSPNPETEAMERAKDSKQPPREENQGPKPPPGMGSEEKKRGKGTGPAPLPRDGL